MINQEYIILSAHGLHARPATVLIKLVKNYKSAVSLKKGDKEVRLNSLLNILSLTLKGGDTITVMIDGEDEVSAAVALNHFFLEQLKNL
jgi:phosphocarrier protein HPr